MPSWQKEARMGWQRLRSARKAPLKLCAAHYLPTTWPQQPQPSSLQRPKSEVARPG